MATVAEVLTAATDSVNLINTIKDGTHLLIDRSQQELNDIVQRNVDHLKLILEYTEPNVKGSSNSKKTDCNTAIATGNTYILDNSV